MNNSNDFCTETTDKLQIFVHWSEFCPTEMSKNYTFQVCHDIKYNFVGLL